MGGRCARAGRRVGFLACALGALLLAVVGPSASAAGSLATASGPLASAAQVGPAPAAQPIQLVLPLTANDAGLRQLALSVSTPGSPDYGHYESIATLARRFGASPSTRARVVSYLRSVGASNVKLDATGLFADATMSVALAERLFLTPIAQFRTARNARFVAPTSSVSIPVPLQGLVQGVVGLDTRPLFTPHKLPVITRSALARAHAAAQTQSGYEPRSGTASGCGRGQGSGGFTPNQYLTAYGYDPLHGAGISGQGERVALIEIDGFRYSDITTFASCFGLRVPAINGYGVGLANPLPPGGESTLDLEVLDAAAPGLKAIDVYESKAGAADALRAFTAPLQVAGNKPQVISASLGLCEQALVDTVGAHGINATESALEMAAASGITFLASSGDAGSSDCVNSDGSPQHRLAVNYPASSWWVTGVGGTNIALNAANQLTGQVVWNDLAVAPGSSGGGGLSNGLSRPSYQHGTVLPNRRAVPDVSMLADIAPGYAIYCSAAPDCISAQSPDPWTTVGGTSAGTPLLAGGVALVDQALRQHGRQDLGLANPLLYAIGRNSTLASQVFYDVQVGTNDVGPYIPGDGTLLGCCTAGVGFDYASGWGGVNVAQFNNVALVTQPGIVNVGLSLPPHQRPVASHKLLATVSCSGGCLLAAAAQVTIGRTKFVVTSNTYRLRGAGQKTVSLGFSGKQIGKLSAALRVHRRVVAQIVGVIVDPGGNIERRSSTQTLTISS